jgi:prepilin-type N-terminal cleavage/methylation domain-containing protein
MKPFNPSQKNSGQFGSGQSNSGQSNSGRNRGFSLLEVMVAISVLSIVVLAISLIPALGLGRNNDARTYAVNVAREVLDSYRSKWQDRKDFRQGIPPTLPGSLSFDCVLRTPLVLAYTINTKSFALESTVDIPKVRQVTVVIDCPQAGQTSLSTYIGDPNPAGP